MVFVHLGRKHRARHRDESRLFHDAAYERFAWRDFPAGAAEAMAIGFRSARNNLTFGYGRFPWVALSLCTTFGLYGLLRKKSGTAAIPGLFIETVLLVPLASAYLIFLKTNGQLMFGSADISLSILLMSTGIVTALPQVWFGHAAQHLRLTTLGFLQYLAPTGTFFLGVFAYHEPFTRNHLITFALIWIALAIFTGEAVMRWRRRSVPGWQCRSRSRRN